MSSAAQAAASAETPMGTLQPAHERAIRALKALAEDRIDDARANTELIPDAAPADAAWKHYLRGLVAFHVGQLEVAAETFEKGAALALESAAREPDDGRLFRVAGHALEQFGRVARRREQLAEAMRAHEAAYRLFVEHGSADEQWAGAMGLALDLQMRRDFGGAAAWFERAIECSRGSSKSPGLNEALAQARLAAVLGALERSEQAAATARAACDLWRAVQPGSVEAFRAEIQAGHALLMHAQSLVETQPALAAPSLKEAMSYLERAKQELSAFGTDTADDVRRCNDQLDFAGRLLAMTQGSPQAHRS